MSPENPARKVNTILKCQEINDIVLSSYGPVEEGDKCLALFTPFLPVCEPFPLSLSSLSPSLCLRCPSLTVASSVCLSHGCAVNESTQASPLQTCILMQRTITDRFS